MSSGSGEFLFPGLCERGVDLAADVAFEAALDLAFALALAGAAVDVGPGRLVVAHADEDDAVECGVGLAVAAPVEPVAVCLARGGVDRGGAAEHREGGLGAEPFGVVAGGDQERAGGVGADAERLDEPRRGSSGELSQLSVEAGDLGFECLVAAGEVSECALAGGQRAVERPERSRAALPTSLLVERARSSSRSSGSAVTSSERSALIAWVRALIAVWRATRSTRIISTRSSPALGEPAASTDKTVRAAASASVGSDLPLRRRVWRLGRITSITSTLRARRWRARPAP